MGQYFENDANLGSKPRFVLYQINGQSFTLKSDIGVFSKDTIDRGTYIFLKVLLSLNLGERILDLGSSYGALGLTLASFMKDASVTLAEINTRALTLCKENAHTLGLDSRVTCLQSDIYSNIEGTFNSIVINPPTHAGKKVIYEMYKGAKNHLIDGGSLFIVIKKSLGASSSMKFLEDNYGNCTLLERDKGYHIYQAIKK